jgi:hypothetical protein
MWLPTFMIPARLAPDAATRHAIARLGASIAAVSTVVAAPQVWSAVARWTDAGCWLRDAAACRARAAASPPACWRSVAATSWPPAPRIRPDWRSRRS